MTQAITAIHQFHHSVDAGDGVTNSLLFIQRLLRQMGFASEIYAAGIPVAMEERVRPCHELEQCSAAHTLLLQHHSMGHDLGDWIKQLPLPRTLVYHNITPPDFFAPGSDTRRYAELGREQLAQWRDDFHAVLAVSDYNAEDLVALGYAPNAVTVISLLVDTEGQGGISDTETDSNGSTPSELARQLHPALANRPALLFVGRLVENKRQHLLLEALWHLQRMQHDALQPSPMLVLAGGGHDSDYARFLRQRTHQLELDDSVLMPGKVSDTLLRALYQHSAAFVCASAHEGFGMPLVEAMLADCPVVAMGVTNIPHTLGEGGLVLDSEDPAVLAACLALLLEDTELHAEVISGQRRSLVRYRPERLISELTDWLVGTLDIKLPVSASRE